LFHSTNLHWHSLVIQSPYFLLDFTLAVVHSMGSDKFLMLCSHHWSTTENGLTALKTLWVSAIPLYHQDLLTFSFSCANRVKSFFVFPIGDHQWWNPIHEFPIRLRRQLSFLERKI
jgi:hypothetical protein